MFSKDPKKRLKQIEYALKYNSHLTEEGRKKLEQMKVSMTDGKVSKVKKNTTKENEYGIKKGDVFVSTFGYDATFHDFYEVTDVLGKTKVKVKELNKKAGDYSPYGACDWTVRPIKNEYADDKEYIRSVKTYRNDSTKGKTETHIKDKYSHHNAYYVENPFDHDWHEDNYH